MAHTFVTADKAPEAKRPNSRSNARMKEFDGLMLEVKANAPQVLRLTPEGQDSVRAMRLRVAQSITRLNKKGGLGGEFEAWTGEDDAVYVKFVAKAATIEPKAEPAAAPAKAKAS